MKAALEKIEPGFGSSFSIRKFTGHALTTKPKWHFHPEYEIVYISNGSGKRHIGNHISHYNNGDLIFLGPNLPHFGFVDHIKEEHVELVIQMKEDFLGSKFLEKPEMTAIKQLFERSRRGLSFYDPIKKEIGEQLVQLTEKNNFEKLIELLKILNELAYSQDYEMLNVGGFSLEVNAQDHQRMRAIYNFTGLNFRRPISLKEIAAEVNMTIPAFCRYFRKLTGKTFTKFVNEYRVAHACKLLAEDDGSISEVCFESGFNNFSHFNKQFKKLTGHSPSEYRKEQRKVVE